jgi:hypothetical protein
MINPVLSAALFAFLLLVSPVSAKTYPIPSENPVATISMPNSWEPNEYDKGVEGTSKDGQFYFAIEAVESKDVGDATKEAMVWFRKQGVKLDNDSRTVNETTLNDLPVLTMTFKGRDKDGPTEVTLILVKVLKPNSFLLIYAWGSEKAAQDNIKDIDKILASLAPTK